jgi:hypothetical protein
MNWRVNNMRITEISYNIAVPAPKMDIFKYIISAGKYGRLFIGSSIDKNKYSAEQDQRTNFINCKCNLKPTIKESKEGAFYASKSRIDAVTIESNQKAFSLIKNRWSK